MKRILTFITLLTCLVSIAQNVDDVLRYSTENLQGTARFQGMAGAFGALGGDLSALNINPAGSAVFNNSILTVSASYFKVNTESNYDGSFTQADNNNTDINQVGGGALVFKSNDTDSPWKKFTLAVNYDMVDNYDNYIVAGGLGTEGIDNYFLNFASGIPLQPLKLQLNESIGEAYLDIGATNDLGFAGQQAFLGFQAGIIEPVNDQDENTEYFANETYTNINQDYRQSTSGYNSKFVVNAATQFEDFLYLGASLNFHTIVYDRLSQYDEEFFNADGELRTVAFDERLSTDGSGFSFSLGAIAKVNNILRLGGSYQSPTWYRLSDAFAQGINSNYPPFKDSGFYFGDLRDFNLFDYQIKLHRS